jgi:LysR family pca operon transcriptional activator
MTLGALRPVWFISRGVVADDLDAGRLVALDLDMGPTEGAVGIMARSEENPSPLVGLFRGALSDAAKSLDSGRAGD